MSPDNSPIAQIRKAANKEHRLTRRVQETAYVTDKQVIVSSCDGESIPEHERIFADQIVGIGMGPLFASYPNIPLKAVYETLARSGDHTSEIPEYFYSCPAIDDMLLGHHPKTYYFDISRGGPVSVIRRSMGYVKLAQEKHKLSQSPKMKDWVRTYGIGTCIPIITFDSLVSYAVNNEARMYAVPATSVAESLTACAVYFAGMRSDLRRITSDDSWMNTAGQSRNKGSLKIYEALHRYIVSTRGQDFFNDLILNGSNITQISQLYLEMTERHFLLGSTRESICNIFAEIVFDPLSPRSHPNYGAQADCSEIVVRGKSILKPVPWEAVILYGDNIGTTREQVLKLAESIKTNEPSMTVIVLVDKQGNLLQPNYGESVIPGDAEFMSVAWASYLFESKISRQKNQLFQQQIIRG